MDKVVKEDFGNNIENVEEEINDKDRTTIRAELSSLSFEELQKLKEKIGAKVYKEAIFGSNKKEQEKPKVFKRVNKNRPREMSSKKPVSMLRDVPKIKKEQIRDPRFDSLCGEFDKKQFSHDYNFLSDLRVQDINAIKAELNETTDPERETKLRRLLQRVSEQDRVSKKKKIDTEQIENKKKSIKKDLNAVKLPHFKNKSEQRVEALVKQYEELKSEGAGRIQRHLQRRQQKTNKKASRSRTIVSWDRRC